MGRGSCEMLVQIRTQVLDAVGLARRVRAVELICLRCYKLSTDLTALLCKPLRVTSHLLVVTTAVPAPTPQRLALLLGSPA